MGQNFRYLNLVRVFSDGVRGQLYQIQIVDVGILQVIIKHIRFVAPAKDRECLDAVLTVREHSDVPKMPLFGLPDRFDDCRQLGPVV